jgi:citrate synthase
LHVHFGSALALRCDRIELALDAPVPEQAPVAEMSVPPLGFRHPLYTDGDPRARLMVELASTLRDRKDLLEYVLLTLLRIDNHGGVVSLDAALVAVCRALGFSGLAAGGILAVSRCAGWIAHVLEQSQQDFMIRPRGKFSLDGSSTGQSTA